MKRTAEYKLRRTQACSDGAPSPWRSTRRLGQLSTLAMGALCGGVIAWGTVSASADRVGRRDVTANAAHTTVMRESVHATNVNHKGSSVINDRGWGTGTFKCPVQMQLRVSYTKGTAGLKCYTSAGVMTASGQAAFFAAGQVATFTGTMTITHGAGKYAHARGQLRMEGTMQRKTFALEAYVTGTVSY